MTAELNWFFTRFGLPVCGAMALAFMAGLGIGITVGRKNKLKKY